ncbi:hypothetical protein JCGZ_18877 [Jatropha curcas]|uniref:AIG1-type G domain-containing protein n=1 Tax=Jatropha curcas TaxID=180498 RepID=A0A067JV91_JATCU|nr:translocase of chloroplast 159, chloroplastic [Jatropha curcas]KDP27797.1 hypothetical protein JCGZ_18877 [Jatropha curcas]
MASKPQVSLLTTQGPPSLSGSLAIRAPITPEDDSSDFESNGHTSDISSSVDNGSEAEEYVSGEEFESASEKLFVGDSDEEKPEASVFFGKYKLSRPYMTDTDEESVGNPESGVTNDFPESGVTNEFKSVKLDNTSFPRVIPIAQLSMDDDDFEELMSDEDIASGGGADGRFSGPSFGVLENVDSAPRVKVSDGSDVDEDKEIELLVQSDFSAVNESEFLLTRDNGNLVSGKFVGADNGVSGREDDAFAAEGPINEHCSVELIKDDFHVEPLVENNKNSEMKEDVKLVVDYSVSIELVEDDGHVAAESHIESLVECEENVLETGSQLDDDAMHFVDERLPFENLEQAKIELNGTDCYNENSMVVNDFNYQFSEHCSASPVKEQIAEVVNVCDDIVAELKVDDSAVLLKEHTSFETVIKPVDDSVQKIVLEPQELEVEVEAEKAADFKKNYDGSDALEEGSDYGKLEDKTGPETGMSSESLAREDAIKVESGNHADEMALDLLVKRDLPEMSEHDRLEKASQGNIKDEVKLDSQKIGAQKSWLSDEDIEDMIFRSSGTSEHIMSELQRSFSPSPLPVADDFYDGQIVPDSDDELETDKDHDEKGFFDSAALAALLKAAASAKLDGRSITITSADGSRAYTFDHPVGSGSSFDTIGRTLQSDTVKAAVNENISEEEKKKIEKIHHIRVKFLRLVQRLGQSSEDSIVASLLHKLFLAAGEHVSQEFSLESAKRMVMQLEAEGKDDLDFCLNILVFGKTGVGKSATINSIFGEKKVVINAFEPATTRVKEVVGTVDGVRIRILDTPGLRTPVKDEPINRKILASIKKWIKKFPPDVVLYVDRLDAHTKDLNDLPLLVSLTNSLSASIWRNAIVILTHASASPPDGPSGSPLNFEMFATQRAHAVQLSISRATGDPRLMDPSMMHPVSFVENHLLCQKNKEGERVLPNGQSWRPQLLLLCYSLKILSELEANLKTKPQDPYDHKKMFGLRLRSLPLSHLVSSLLQCRPHPKLTADQGSDDVDSDVELLDLSDSDGDDDEYDQLPPFKPLMRSQINKLSKEHKRAYLEEYDYRAKLLQKKQWREEIKRLKELKKKGKDSRIDHVYTEEDFEQEEGGPAVVPVTMPDFALSPSFDSDNPSYRYRMLEPTSELLVRPIVESQGWDHDCGYDGIALDRNLAVAGRFPSAFTVQVMKDKKVFNIRLDSSICAKHKENGSTMAGFDVQTFGRQLACILRAETKVKNFKINKTTAGISITLLGKRAATGLKIEDQITVGKRLALVGSAGAVTSEGDTAYGANFEVRLKSKDFPMEQDQTTLGLSLLNWRGNLGVTANLQSQFSVGRNSKMAINVGMNNKQSGQITIKTSSSELQFALISIVPMVISALKSVYSGCAARN